jgi:predicted  nucleic acid-binding Zn-ribbon protein
LLPDLERLIQLQRLDTAADEARRLIASAPQRLEALDAELEEARAALAAARQKKAANDDARRAADKELAAVKSRRSKFMDQTMEVKTNREFHALQHEIQMADDEIKRIEDGLLEQMLAADEIAAAVKAAEQAFADAERSVAAQKQAIEAERQQLAASLDDVARERHGVAAATDPSALSVFESVAKTRRGLAVAEARDGLCSVCHVRLRPQVYQDVRRNSQIVQCESCQRILYYVAPPASPSETRT